MASIGKLFSARPGTTAGPVRPPPASLDTNRAATPPLLFCRPVTSLAPLDQNWPDALLEGLDGGGVGLVIRSFRRRFSASGRGGWAPEREDDQEHRAGGSLPWLFKDQRHPSVPRLILYLRGPRPSSSARPRSDRDRRVSPDGKRIRRPVHASCPPRRPSP